MLSKPSVQAWFAKGMKTFQDFRLLVGAELLLTHWAFYFLFHVIEKTFSLGHDFFRSKIENVDTYAKGPYNSSVNWYKAEVYLPSCDNNCNISTLDRYAGVKQHTYFYWDTCGSPVIKCLCFFVLSWWWLTLSCRFKLALPSLLFTSSTFITLVKSVQTSHQPTRAQSQKTVWRLEIIYDRFWSRNGPGIFHNSANNRERWSRKSDCVTLAKL